MSQNCPVMPNALQFNVSLLYCKRYGWKGSYGNSIAYHIKISGRHARTESGMF